MLVVEESEDYVQKLIIYTCVLQFFLFALGDKASARVRSAAMAFIRPVSRGAQSYDSKPQQYPLTKPLNKLTAKAQVNKNYCARGVQRIKKLVN